MAVYATRRQIVEGEKNFKEFIEEQKDLLYIVEALRLGKLYASMVDRSTYTETIKTEVHKDLLLMEAALSFVEQKASVFFPLHTKSSFTLRRLLKRRFLKK